MNVFNKLPLKFLQSLCNACGIRMRKHLARSLNEEDKPKGRKRKISKIQSNRPTPSASTNCSTTHIATGTSTSTTAKSASASAAANGNASDRGRGRDSVLAVRFVVKKPKVMKNQKVVKKLRRYQRRRTNFKRTGFYFFSKKLRKLGEEEQAAVALLALSCGCGSVST